MIFYQGETSECPATREMYNYLIQKKGENWVKNNMTVATSVQDVIIREIIVTNSCIK